MNKICGKCNIEKDISEFYSNGYDYKQKKKYKPNCKLCEKLRKYELHRERLYQVLEEQDREYKCEKCGYNKNHAALVFHHFTNEKNFEISSSKTRSKEKLYNEILICDLLCQNCHHELHNPNMTI